MHHPWAILPLELVLAALVVAQSTVRVSVSFVVALRP